MQIGPRNRKIKASVGSKVYEAQQEHKVGEGAVELKS